MSLWEQGCRYFVSREKASRARTLALLQQTSATRRGAESKTGAEGRRGWPEQQAGTDQHGGVSLGDPLRTVSTNLG